MDFYILAGGRSRRLGRNKALVEIAGTTVIERILAAVPKGHAVKIITDATHLFDFLPVAKMPDRIPGLGPIGGLHAGLSDTDTPYAFFLPCDLPLISTPLIERLMGEPGDADVVCYRTPRGVEPLCALYARRCLSTIEEHIQRGEYSLQRLLEALQVKMLPSVEEEALFNLNTPKDLRLVQERVSRLNPRARSGGG